MYMFTDALQNIIYKTFKGNYFMLTYNFKDLDLVEHITSGMGRIMTVYNKDNFEFMEHFLRIRIPFEKGYEFTEQNEQSSEKSRDKGREKILNILSENAMATMSEIAEQLNLSPKAIEKQISQLKKENKIRRVGGRKEGHWKVL